MAPAKGFQFSARLRWELSANSLSELLERKRRSGDSVLDLTESNPTRAGLNYETVRVLDPLRARSGLIYEPAAAGLNSAREAVASYYASRGREIDPGCILLTSSTSEAYGYLFKLLANPGDEILVPRPSYPLLEYLARLDAVTPKPYPLFYQEGWWLDLNALRAVLSPKTKAIVTVSPNNPTGSYLKAGERDALIELCRRHKLALICDEVFADYALKPAPDAVGMAAGSDRALTFSLSGLSKVIGLPQMKLGWIVVSGPEHLRRQALDRLELIADTYLSVATPVQHAAARWLELCPAFQRQVLVRLRGNLHFLRSTLKESPCRLLEVEGGWYASVRIPQTLSEQEWVLRFLAEDNVLVQPGFFYDFASEAYIVLSLLTPPDKFQQGVTRLVDRIGNL